MRLLIVEDDPDGREMLAEVFRLRDWAVTAVPTTGAAMTELRAGGFDVVISDEDLHGQSGSSMLRQAAEEGLLRNVGALMYTAESRELHVPDGVRVLRKPLAIAAIVDEARATLPEDAPQAPSSTKRPRCKPVELVLYVTSSASSQRALRNLEQVLAKTHPARIRVLVRDLESEPIDPRHDDYRINTPVLVQMAPGPELEHFGADLESAQRLTALIEELDAQAREASQGAFGESPPSSRQAP